MDLTYSIFMRKSLDSGVSHFRPGGILRRFPGFPYNQSHDGTIPVSERGELSGKSSSLSNYSY